MNMPLSAPTFRILMVLDQDFPPDIRVENEALSLIDAGFDVSLLSVGIEKLPVRDMHRGIHLFRRRLPKQVRNKMRGLAGTVPLLTLFLEREIRKVYREKPFDALHMHDLHLFGGGIRAGRGLGIPVVGDLHENYVDALQWYAWSTRFPGKFVVSIPRWRRIERRWVNAVDRVIVVVEEMKARNIELGVDSNRLCMVSNTIRREEFDRFPVEAEIVASVRSEFTVLYTGGIDLHRGLGPVVRAMPAVIAKIPSARLVVVGEGRTRGELQKLAADLGIDDSVTFTGWQDQALLKSYIIGSHVCLVPHLKSTHTDATIPHKLFHYMYLEKPVVVTDCLPLKRITEETQCGLVFPSGDSSALAKALLALAADPDMARHMGQNGRQAVQERYNWEATARGMVEMYEQLRDH